MAVANFPKLLGCVGFERNLSHDMIMINYRERSIAVVPTHAGFALSAELPTAAPSVITPYGYGTRSAPATSSRPRFAEAVTHAANRLDQISRT
jgi:hypothetical protein